MLKIEEIGLHLVAGFKGQDYNDHLRTLVEEFKVGGLIFFSRNYESPEQLADLIAKVRSEAGRRIFIGVDQEGGRVQRFKEPFTLWPSMRTLGKTCDVTLAEDFGTALGKELAAVGFDWNFAPVLDVDSNPDNPVIGDRAFGSDPNQVAKFGVPMFCAMQKQGVMACAKHYPGHGDTSDDSHLTLPVILSGEDVLYKREWVPFVAAVDAGVASIMTAHVIYPVLDLCHPASMSRVMIAGQLRKAVYYEGLVITDDLEMKAVSERYEPMDLIYTAFLAGNDFLAVCKSIELQEIAIKALYDGRMGNLLAPEMFIESEKRIKKAMKDYPEPKIGDLSVIGCQQHQDLARKIIETAESCER